MKTEDFDDAIRNKLEGLDEQYTSADIDKVHAFVSQQRTASKRRYAMLVAASVAAFFLAGLLGWNIWQNGEYKKLAVENRQLRKALEGQQHTSKTYISKRDTVYITKYITVNAGSDILEKQDVSHNKEVSSQKREAAHLADKAQVKSNIKNEPYQNERQSDNALQGPYSKNENQDSDDQKNEKALTKNNTVSLKTGNNSSNPGSINQDADKDSNSATGTSTASTGENKKENSQAADVRDGTHTAASDKLPIRDSIFAIARQDSLKIKTTAPEPDDLTEAKVNKPKKEWNLGIREIKFAAGPTAEVANKQFGFGITGNVSFNSRWSLSAGLKMLNVNNERYEGPDDFRHRKGADFRDFGGPADSSVVRNIGLRTSILQLPVALNYALLIKDNYAILFGAGTDIDLKVLQHVDFDHLTKNPAMPLPANPEFVHRRIDHSPAAIAFNNIVLMAGIRKDWRKISLQLNSFVSPQVKSVVYKKEDLYAGLHFRMLYNFGM